MNREPAGPAVATGPVIVVARQAGEDALRLLHRHGVLDDSRRVKDDGEIHLPVRAVDDLDGWAARVGGRLVQATLLPREVTRTPHERVVERLHEALAPELRALVPDKWERFGDVLVLRLPEPLWPHAETVAQAFADVMGLNCVLEDREGVAGELREMRARILLGDDPVATHVENGVTYRFDASRVMFSSGNVAERKRAAGIAAEGETVLDMFAGIGYFTLPLAKYARPARVVALEKNPASFAHLQENVRLNGVEDIVECWQGDNRDFPREGIADRVLMGYFPGTAAFLPKALALLKPEGGVLHYHDTAHARTWRDELRAHLDAAAAARRLAVDVRQARIVKSHSPGVVHAVLEARLHRG